MPVYKDDSNGTFFVQCYYRDARGSKRHKTKRGFSSEPLRHELRARVRQTA